MARRKEHYQGGCVLGLSIIQVILGVACIVLQIVLIVNKSAYYFFVEGIWAGVIFIVAGALGIGSSQKKGHCMIIASLTMAIIAAVVAIVGLIPATAFDLGEASSYGMYSVYNNATSNHLPMMVISITGTMIVIAVLQAILFIVSSALACHGLCCGDDNHNASNAEMGHVNYDSWGQQRRHRRNRPTDTQVSPYNYKSNGHRPVQGDRRGRGNEAQSGHLPPGTRGEVRIDRFGQLTTSSPYEPEHRYESLKRGNDHVYQDPDYEHYIEI